MILCGGDIWMPAKDVFTNVDRNSENKVKIIDIIV